MPELPERTFGGYIGYDRLTARIIAYGLTVSLGAMPFDWSSWERTHMDDSFSVRDGGFKVIRASMRLLQAMDTEGSTAAWSVVDGLAVLHTEVN